jgi:predicted PurR-regulated permease PerM
MVAFFLIVFMFSLPASLLNVTFIFILIIILSSGMFQGVITQLSEQISTLNERMDEFTSRIEELNSKFSTRKVSASQQNLALQGEPCNGSGPTSLFVTGLGNGSLTGSILPNSSSSSQLTRESPLMEEVPQLYLLEFLA